MTNNYRPRLWWLTVGEYFEPPRKPFVIADRQSVRIRPTDVFGNPTVENELVKLVSSDPRIADFDGRGNLVAKKGKRGLVTVSVRLDGEEVASCSVEVVPTAAPPKFLQGR